MELIFGRDGSLLYPLRVHRESKGERWMVTTMLTRVHRESRGEREVVVTTMLTSLGATASISSLGVFRRLKCFLHLLPGENSSLIGGLTVISSGDAMEVE